MINYNWFGMVCVCAIILVDVDEIRAISARASSSDANCIFQGVKYGTINNLIEIARLPSTTCCWSHKAIGWFNRCVHANKLCRKCKRKRKMKIVKFKLCIVLYYCCLYINANSCRYSYKYEPFLMNVLIQIKQSKYPRFFV